jgi:RpiR family transcriptional regulator, carbohydrate utilization regulator
VLPWIRGLSPTLKRAQRQIAKAILDDPEQFITQSISELAEGCGVSPGSVVSFCKSLGLRVFPALKIRLARELVEPVFPLGQAKGRRDGSRILQQVFHEHVKALHETLRLNSPRSVQAAALALAGARRVVLFASRIRWPIHFTLGCASLACLRSLNMIPICNWRRRQR